MIIGDSSSRVPLTIMHQPSALQRPAPTHLLSHPSSYQCLMTVRDPWTVSSISLGILATVSTCVPMPHASDYHPHMTCYFPVTEGMAGGPSPSNYHPHTRFHVSATTPTQWQSTVDVPRDPSFSWSRHSRIEQSKSLLVGCNDSRLSEGMESPDF